MHDFSVNGIVGSEFWVNSSELTFKEIQESSFMPYKYKEYSLVSKQFKDSLISPINGYALDFSPMPKILRVDNSIVTFRQLTHAEIWVEPRSNGLYALDKCHQRQFYPSRFDMQDSQCFDANYRFYMPWFVKSKNNIIVKSVHDEFSPFVIQDQVIKNIDHLSITEMIEPLFVNFLIKKEGLHMHSTKYGIIEIGTPMYDFSIELTKEEMNMIDV